MAVRKLNTIEEWTLFGNNEMIDRAKSLASDYGKVFREYTINNFGYDSGIVKPGVEVKNKEEVTLRIGKEFDVNNFFKWINIYSHGYGFEVSDTQKYPNSISRVDLKSIK